MSPSAGFESVGACVMNKRMSFPNTISQNMVTNSFISSVLLPPITNALSTSLDSTNKMNRRPLNRRAKMSLAARGPKESRGPFQHLMSRHHHAAEDDFLSGALVLSLETHPPDWRGEDSGSSRRVLSILTVCPSISDSCCVSCKSPNLFVSLLNCSSFPPSSICALFPSYRTFPCILSCNFLCSESTR